MRPAAHLQCASYEMPISLSDEKWFGSSMRELCDSSLVKDKDGWSALHDIVTEGSSDLPIYRYHPHPNFLPYPSGHISIRTSLGRGILRLTESERDL